MRTFIIIIFAIILSSGATGQGDEASDLIDDSSKLSPMLFNDLKNQRQELKKVKYYLLNGETRLAGALLFKLSYSETKLRPVILRYLATLSFVQNDFEKTYEYLSHPSLLDVEHFHKICVLRTLSEIVLNKKYDIEKNWNRCKLENADKFSQKRLIWPEILIQLKFYPHEGISKVPFKKIHIASLDNEETKMILKLALYLNQEKILVHQIPDMTFDQVEDPEIQELIGHLLFRSGDFVKSYPFIKDLKSPNAENIKGNIYLQLDKKKQAQGEFEMALEKKLNSQNALERLLPLAWQLEDWEGGIKYAELIEGSPQKMASKLILLSAFLTRKGDHQKALKVLDKMTLQPSGASEIEVSSLLGFTHLMLNNPEAASREARKNCFQSDLISCWLLFQFSQWDSFPEVIKRNDLITQNKGWEKLIKEDIDQPIHEEIFVNQLDIEELDDRGMKFQFEK
jgi:hypothetical protein